MLKPRGWNLAALIGFVVLCGGLQTPAPVSAEAADKTAPTSDDGKAVKAEAKGESPQPPSGSQTSAPSLKKEDGQKTGKDSKAEAAGKQGDKKRSVARIRISGDYPEGPASPGLFGAVQTSLSTMVDRLEQAAQDEQVAAVILDIDQVEIGRGKLNELRAAIARLRAAGKPVYAQLAGADSTQYLLASACDEIVLSPQAYLIIPGVRAEAMFFKGLLDQLGIRMQVLQMGKYKSAGEPLTNRELSPPARENLEALVDDSYEALIADIAKDRHLDEDQVKQRIDQGLFTAKAARGAGLVDQLLYPDELPGRIEKRLKTDHLDIIEGYRKKKIDTNMSGMGGLMKLMEMAFGGGAEKPKPKGRKIAVVYAVGMIVPGEGADGVMSDMVVGAKTLVEALKKAAKDDDVVAIVLRVDSPGGSAVASDLIWREVMQVKSKKPIIASMGDVAGSGGYYIAMGASRVVAEPLSITGSIGVIGGKPSVGKLLDKLGISTQVISRGKNAGSLSLVDPFTPGEQKAWMQLMKDTYQQFVAKAAEGRKMPRKEMAELAQGRVYTGRMALAKGLVDRLGTLHDAVIEAKKAAGLKPEEKVDLWMLPEPQSFLERLFADPAAMENAHTATAQLGDMLTKAVFLQRLFAEPSLVLMPQWVRLK